jgi:protein-tyrosine-phosphatase
VVPKKKQERKHEQAQDLVFNSKMKILFICRHNVFRSRVAEEYMKKISKHEISSGGLIKFNGNLHPIQEEVCKEFGLILPNQSKALSVENLKDQDLVVIVADDVPKGLINEWYVPKDKLRRWEISDVYPHNMNKEEAKKVVEEIIKKVDELNEELSS